jgi:hypothetical protein
MKTLPLVLLLVVGAALGAAVPARSATVEPPLCGTSSRPPPATYDHVVWIWFENHSFGSIVHSPDAPFINHTLVNGCGLATNYHNITHPSLPNYIAATSGLGGAALARFRSDCNAVGPCRSRAPSIFAQAPSWGAYAESMIKPCQLQFKAPYAASHNPAVYYRSLTACTANDVGVGQLSQDLSADTLPAFVMITPNMCHSMHSCSVRTGDAWLAKMMATLVASPAYQAGSTVIFVTFDEGNDGGSNRCATNTHDQGCHVPLFVISPYTEPGTRSEALFNHYSLLRTTEELLGIDTFLGHAANASSMRTGFNL